MNIDRIDIDFLKEKVEKQGINSILKDVENLHPADLALLIQEIDSDDARRILLSINPEKAADTITEMDEDDRLKFLKTFSPRMIAKVLIENMETDDAADILGEMDEDEKDRVLSHVSDVEHAGDIVDLLDYEEDTAGGLMQKEYVAVREDWSVKKCIEEIRRQAEEIEEIYYVYVIDNQNIFKGVLSLKKLITSNPNILVKKIYQDDVIKVKVNTPAEDVVNLMDKYDLVSLPVIDSLGRLVGRITFDDVVDVMREEAEKDYQLASGITSDVEISDTVWQLSKARIPWLLFGLFGELINSRVIGIFEEDLSKFAATAFFLPLIAATGGNVGIQSSAIVVQAIANGSFKFHSFWKKILKEFSVALLNAFSLSAIIFTYGYFILKNKALTLAVSVALFTVVIFASLFGIIVPMTLNKFKIDPAIATGPFITIVNDITGMAIYLTIARFLYSVM